MTDKDSELAPGYHKVEPSEEETKKEYDVDEDFLEKALSHVEASDVTKFLRKCVVKRSEEEKK